MLALIPAAVLGLSSLSTDAPRLTVVISIDQFRADFVTRFAEHYLPAVTKDGVGGFRWLAEKGANFVNAAYNHVPTETGPGHAVIGTGSTPSLNGIVGNNWFDRKSGKSMYCVGDASAKDIHTGSASYSARNLQVTTFGDELKMATGGRSKNVSVALKDRASILMAGRIADDVVWFDNKSGIWTSSDAYYKNGKLSDWLIAFNNKRLPDKNKGQSWTMSLPKEAYAATSVPEKPGMPSEFGKTFPHPLPNGGEKYYEQWTRTPWANAWVLDTAKEAIAARAMGQDAIPDLLTINLSTNDYVGHWFGPDSPEVLDISVQTDKQLASFFRYLDKNVPGGLGSVLIVVTADHGVCPMPEELVSRGIPGGRYDLKKMTDELKAAVEEEFETAGLIKYADDFMVYLDRDLASEEVGDYSDVEMFIRDWLRQKPEIETAITRWEVEEQQLVMTDVTRKLVRSFNRNNSGDVFFFFRPGWYPSSYASGTGHGSPWSYDTRVPLLFAGKWVKPGRHADISGPEDIAATVCAAIGLLPPNGNVGRALQVANEKTLP